MQPLDGYQMAEIFDFVYHRYIHVYFREYTENDVRKAFSDNPDFLETLGLKLKDIEPYIEPVYAGIQKCKDRSLNMASLMSSIWEPSLFETDVNLFHGEENAFDNNKEYFRRAWDYVVDKIFYNDETFPDVQVEVLHGFHGRHDFSLMQEMLFVCYEIVKNLPFGPDRGDIEEQKLRQEIDKLYEDVVEYRDSHNFNAALKFIAHFKQMAPFNAAMVNIQKPGSRYVATPARWREMGRYPKAGVRPLVIMQPFGPVCYVYELNDTEGKPVPDEVLNPFQIEGSAEGLLDQYVHSLWKEGIAYRDEDYGTTLAGFIQVTSKGNNLPLKEHTDKNGHLISCVPHEYDMLINRNLSETEKCATLFHELGHYFCGHLPHSPKNKNVPKYRQGLRHSTREFEAETVCWLVCKRKGIDNPSASYLHDYLEENREIPKGISMDAILKAVGKIESLIERTYAPRSTKA